MPETTRRAALNKELALLSGWKMTPNRNWRRAPSGRIFALPPDYCRGRRALSNLMMSFSDAEREATVKFLVTMKEKRKGLPDG